MILTKQENEKLLLYGILTNSIITEKDNLIIIDNPDETIAFFRKKDLIKFVNYNLQCIKEIYTVNNELSQWEIALAAAEMENKTC